MSFAMLFDKREDCAVVALCDPNHVRTRESAKQLPGEQACYTSLQAMLDDASLDIVVITSPDYLHAEHAKTALGAGVHILIDKPLATTAKGCKEIIAAAERHDKVAMVGFNLRHAATLRRLKEMIDAGELGRVFMIENREFYHGGKTYMARWNRKYEWSGGLWVHKGSHDFDVFNWLLGFPAPRRVTAMAGVSVLTPDHLPFEKVDGKPVGPSCSACAYADICPDYLPFNDAPWGQDAKEVDQYTKDLCIYLSDKDTHDNGVAIVEYDNGVRASHLECFVTGQSDRLYTVMGEKAQAEVSLTERTIRVRPRWSGDIVTHTLPEDSGGHGGSDPQLVDTFVNVVRGNAAVPSTLEHGLMSTAIGEAAEIARRESRVVNLNELI